MKTYFVLATLLLMSLFSSEVCSQVLEGELLFRPADNAIKFEEQRLFYDFSGQKNFILGKKKYPFTSIIIRHGNVQQLTEERVDRTHFYHRIEGFRWPKDFLLYGKITVFSANHPELKFEYLHDEDDSKKWQEIRIRMKEKSKDRWEKSKFKGLIRDFRYDQVNTGIYPVQGDLKKIMDGVFYFCVEDRSEKSWIKICSPKYKRNRKGFNVLVRKRGPRKVSVLINGKKASLKGVYDFSQGIDFKVLSSDGFSLEFFSRKDRFELDEVLQDGNQIHFVGHGEAPYGSEKIGPQWTLAKMLEFVGWRDTILPRKSFWLLKREMTRPNFPCLKEAGKIFDVKVLSMRMPAREDKVKLDNVVEATYRSKFKVRGRCNDLCNLSVEDPDKIKLEGETFEWDLSLKNKQAVNRSLLTVNDGGQRWKATHEIYLASSSEISGRFSGIVTTDGLFTPLLEVSGAHWFEKIFGSDDYWLSFQRWGLSIRYFKTLANILIDSQLEPEPFQTLNVDMKYRFVPGVWGLRESAGVSLSFQNTQLGDRVVPLAGLSIFWAKSMPQIFDIMISWLPFMDYPKWVDMEFVYFPLSLDGRYSVNGFWNLNFHGKILWSQTIFGEAGFGLRNVNFIDQQELGQFQFLTAYATVGLGIQF